MFRLLHWQVDGCVIAWRKSRVIAGLPGVIGRGVCVARPAEEDMPW